MHWQIIAFYRLNTLKEAYLNKFHHIGGVSSYNGHLFLFLAPGQLCIYTLVRCSVLWSAIMQSLPTGCRSFVRKKKSSISMEQLRVEMAGKNNENFVLAMSCEFIPYSFSTSCSKGHLHTYAFSCQPIFIPDWFFCWTNYRLFFTLRVLQSSNITHTWNLS